jgi:hypothetical protein
VSRPTLASGPNARSARGHRPLASRRARWYRLF